MTEENGTVNPTFKGPFCLTPTAQDIIDLLDYSRENGEIGVVVGNPGVGKTMTFAHYAQHDSLAHLCTFTGGTSSLSGAMGVVCKALGSWPAHRTAETYEILCNAVYWEVKQKGILIFDETQELPTQSIDQFRHLHDETGVAMVFCGNDKFQNRYNNPKSAAFSQFTSRVGMRLELWETTAGDIAAICEHHNVTDDKARSYLGEVAKSAGGLRTVTKLIRWAMKIAGDEPSGVTIKHLKFATNVLGVNQ